MRTAWVSTVVLGYFHSELGPSQRSLQTKVSLLLPPVWAQPEHTLVLRNESKTGNGEVLDSNVKLGLAWGQSLGCPTPLPHL